MEARDQQAERDALRVLLLVESSELAFLVDALLFLERVELAIEPAELELERIDFVFELDDVLLELFDFLLGQAWSGIIRGDEFPAGSARCEAVWRLLTF